MQERPKGITVLAILYFIIGVFTIFGAAIAIGIIPWIGALSIVVGIFALAVGSLLWTGRKYEIIIALLIIGIVFDIALAAMEGVRPILYIIIALAILLYMTRPGVKEFFGK